MVSSEGCATEDLLDLIGEAYGKASGTIAYAGKKQVRNNDLDAVAATAGQAPAQIGQ